MAHNSQNLLYLLRSLNTTKSTNFASEQVIAFFLAQEGAEIAQRARDDLILENLENSSNGGWDEFVDESGTFQNCYDGCGLELNTDGTGSLRTPVNCDAIENCRMNFSSGNGRAEYTYQNIGDESPYTRVITFENVSSDEVRIQSQVYWRSGSQRDVQQVEVVTYLFNVYDR